MRDYVTVLVADDNFDDRVSLRDLLEARGYVVLEAADTQRAIATAIESVPDLVVLDIEMPPDDGYSVCKRLRAEPRTRNVPLLMLTCHGLADERVAGLRAGADDYLVKPCENDEFLARVDALFRRYPPAARFVERIEHACDVIDAAEVFRRPCVVLSVDVQESSRPPASFRNEYLRTVVFADYRSLVEATARAHGGAPVAWAGDGGTTEFEDAARAVAAGMAMLRARANHHRVSQLVLRIGIAAGQELLAPGSDIGRRTSQTHNRAGHFQKHCGPNMITVGYEVLTVLRDPSQFRERPPIDGEVVFEGC